MINSFLSLALLIFIIILLAPYNKKTGWGVSEIKMNQLFILKIISWFLKSTLSGLKSNFQKYLAYLLYMRVYMYVCVYVCASACMHFCICVTNRFNSLIWTICVSLRIKICVVFEKKGKIWEKISSCLTLQLVSLLNFGIR